MKSILITTVLLIGFQSQAIGPSGPSTSGGGGAFVCRDSNRQVINSELLDLWEAKNLYGWNVEYSTDPAETQIMNALSRLSLIDSHVADLANKELVRIQANALYLPASVALTAPVDANHLFAKPGCPLEGMLYYDAARLPTEGLIVDNAIFQKLLTPTDVAAAWLHESIYKIYRDKFGASASINARKLTACIFSTDLPCLNDLSSKLVPMATNSTIYQCDSPDVKLEAFMTGDEFNYQWVMVIFKIGSRVFSKPVFASSGYLLENGAYLFDRRFVGGLSSAVISIGDFNYGNFDAAFLRVLPGPTPKINIIIKGWSTQMGENFYTDDYATAINMKCRTKK